MAEVEVRVGIALVLAVSLWALLLRVPQRRQGVRDLTLVGYAMSVAVLGVFAVFGLQAATIAGSIVVGAFLLGLAIYVLLGIASRWAQRD